MPAQIDARLETFLTEAEILSKEQIAQALEQQKISQQPLAEIILEHNWIAVDSLGKIMADLYELPYQQLAQVKIPPATLKILPDFYAREHQVIAFAESESSLSIASAQPENKLVAEAIRKKSGRELKLFYTTPAEIQTALGLYAQNIAAAFESLIQKNLSEVNSSTKVAPPIIKIVETIIEYAFKNRASDIHLEPSQEEFLVRFRIDGVLQNILSLPIALYPLVVTRIKVLARLRTDERSEPQDGKISHSVSGEDLDIRVSVAPMTSGEKIVMRLLSKRSRLFKLADLGLTGPDLIKIERAYTLPHGMILATGPTGSGKTTTLYTLLKYIQKPTVNVMTIEDPVEYNMDGVNQMQVNPRADLTFSTGLRSIVRQDPDVILVGEIRDEETAGIAVNSAMTGHLVLSSVHTNDAPTTVPRLIDMKVEPFLVASSVKVIIAQRLVRKLCLNCRYSVVLETSTLDPVIQKKLGKSKNLQTYAAKGCGVCHHSGYTGRVGMFEILEVDESITEAISQELSAQKIRDLAIKNGMRTMLEDGIQKVKLGITTLEEVLRVTRS